MSGNTSNDSNSRVKQIVNEMTNLQPSISSLSLTSTTSMEGLESSSTDTVVHVPANAGTPSFSPAIYVEMQQMMAQFKAEMSSLKRKRDADPVQINDGMSNVKRGKPIVPSEHQETYKNAQNSRAKAIKMIIVDKTISRYVQYEDHLVPIPLEVNILVLLTILLICFFQRHQKIWRNNDNKLKHAMSYFVFHRSRHDPSLDLQIRHSCENGKNSRKKLNASSFLSNMNTARPRVFSYKTRPKMLKMLNKRIWQTMKKALQEANEAVETVSNRVKSAEYTIYNRRRNQP